MIGIQNIKTVAGLCQYELFIFNGKQKQIKCTFWHKRSDGLAKCLEIASKKAKSLPQN